MKGKLQQRGSLPVFECKNESYHFEKDGQIIEWQLIKGSSNMCCVDAY